MCTVLLPPGVNPIAVNKYIISCIISRHLVLKLVRNDISQQPRLWTAGNTAESWNQRMRNDLFNCDGNSLLTFCHCLVQGDQKVSVHLMITIQITPSSQHTSFLPHYLAQSDCLAADRHGQGGTRLTLTPSVIPNSNYVIMVSDWKCVKYFACFCTVIIRCTETFDHPVPSCLCLFLHILLLFLRLILHTWSMYRSILTVTRKKTASVV
jgi:hypothetical protein